jgi:hypothetical protein
VRSAGCYCSLQCCCRSSEASTSRDDGEKLACDAFVDEWWRCSRLLSLETAVFDNFCGGSMCARPTPVLLSLPPALILTERVPPPA